MIEFGLMDAPPETESEKQDKQLLETHRQLGSKPATKSALESKTLHEIEELDAKNNDDEDEIQSYRKKRLAQLKVLSKAEKYGTVKLISNEEYETEVKKDTTTSTVLLLYRTGHEASRLMETIFENLAPKFKTVKFLKLLASSTIQNFPLEHCPTVMAYRQGKVLGQFVKLDAFAGSKTTADVVEWELSKLQIIVSELSEDPRTLKSNFRLSRARARRKDSDEEGEEED